MIEALKLAFADGVARVADPRSQEAREERAKDGRSASAHARRRARLRLAMAGQKRTRRSLTSCSATSTRQNAHRSFVTAWQWIGATRAS